MFDVRALPHWATSSPPGKPDQIACHLSDEAGSFDDLVTLHYRDLPHLVEALLCAWQQPVAGTRIPVYCDNSLETVVSLVACLTANLVFVQVDPIWFKHHQALAGKVMMYVPTQLHGLSDSSASGAMPDPEKLRQASAPVSAIDVAAIEGLRPVPVAQMLSAIAHQTTADDPYGEVLAWLSTIVSTPHVATSHVPSSQVASSQVSKPQASSVQQPIEVGVENVANLAPGSDNSDDFLIGFTSGSSGRPKAFVRTRQSWIESFRQSRLTFGSCVDTTTLIPGPLSHGLSFYALAESLEAGGTVYLQQRFSAPHCINLLNRMTIDRLVVVPTMLVQLVGYAREHRASQGPRRIISAGDKLSPALLSEVMACWPDTVVSEYYGASELSFVSVAHSTDSVPPGSVGRLFGGVNLRLTTADGMPVGSAEAGQVSVSSPMLARGYLNDDGQTLAPLKGQHIDGEFYATVGDVGRLDRSGYLFLVDRASNMIISGGLNLYPAVVEQALEHLPSVRECRVFGISDALWGQRVVAVIRFADPCNPRHLTPTGRARTRDQLRLHAEKTLEPHECPKDYFWIEDWPLNRSLKIDRVCVQQWLERGHESIMAL